MLFFFFNDTATTEIYTLSLHDALPILEYKIKVLKKVEDLNEKVEALNKFFFSRKLKFEIKDKKLIFEVEKKLLPLVNLFQEKYKDLLGIDIEVKELAEESKSKKN